MRMQAPAGCGGFSHAGREVAVGVDGTVEVAEPVAVVLRSHGFQPVIEQAAPAVSGRGRAGRRGGGDGGK